MSADHLATVALRFAIVLGVFVVGIFVLWLGRQAWRACAMCLSKIQRSTCA